LAAVSPFGSRSSPFGFYFALRLLFVTIRHAPSRFRMPVVICPSPFGWFSSFGYVITFALATAFAFGRRSPLTSRFLLCLSDPFQLRWRRSFSFGLCVFASLPYGLPDRFDCRQLRRIQFLCLYRFRICFVLNGFNFLSFDLRTVSIAIRLLIRPSDHWYRYLIPVVRIRVLFLPSDPFAFRRSFCLWMIRIC
jgi:hypothetical protein